MDPRSAHESQRLDALRRYKVLDTAPEPVFDHLAALAAHVTGCPTALISLVDSDRQWFKAVVDFPSAPSLRSLSMCSCTIDEDGLMIVEDAAADPRFADTDPVTGPPGVRFYAGAPLVTPDGYALGAICAIDYQPRQLAPEQRDALELVATQVMRELEVRRALADFSSTVHGRATEHPGMFQEILDGAPALIYVKDVEGRYLMVNRQYLAQTGRTREEVVGRADADLFPAEAAAQYRGNDLLALTSAVPLEVREQLTDHDYDDVHVLSSHKFAVRDWQGRPYGTCGISSDVTALVHAQAAAQASSARAEMIVAGALDGITAFGADGAVTELNPAAERILGWTREEALGRDLVDLICPELHREPMRAALAAHLRGEGTGLVGERVEVVGHRRDGRTFPMELSVIDVGGGSGRFIGFVRDLSDRRNWEDQLRQLAEQDALTGLANRMTFMRAVQQRSASQHSGAVLVIDLDAFKHINDTFGHRTGDDCLRHVARVMCERTRDGDVLARIGGDEFALLLPGTSVEAARSVAVSLLDLMRRSPLVVQGRPVRMTASIGIAALPSGGAPEDVLHTADAAMYEAKQAGRDRVAVFSEVAAAARTSARHVGQAQDLRNALADGRFALYAQPIVDAVRGVVTSYELLVRMLGTGGRVILPAAFLPAAERFDLVQRIDRWVVRQAVDLLARAAVRDAGASRLRVNLSGRSLSDRSVLEWVERQISAVDPSSLVFEITETAAVTHLGTATAFVERLAAMGFEVSLDDFGAGYASFHYLKHLPIQSVKIDGEFIRGILTDRLDRAVVRATLTLADDMGYRTIAESVETPELLEELRRYGVDDVQGYHLGVPRPVDEVLGLGVRG